MSKKISLMAVNLFTTERKIFRRQILMFIVASIVTVFANQAMAASAKDMDESRAKSQNVQVGPRPYFLVEDMDPGALKATLKQCNEKPLRKTDFSIGHRGAALQFPEHTKESYEAAARMGAGAAIVISFEK